MSLAATLDMLLADATPAVEEALREMARRAYETGYREALASAARAGVDRSAAPAPLPTAKVEAPPLAQAPEPVALLPAYRDDDVEEEDAPASRVGELELDIDWDDEEDDPAADDLDDDDEAAASAEDLSEEGDGVLATVERIVRASKGLAVSEIARQAETTPGHAGRALRALKRSGRIFQGGDRRFARYAADAATALQASLDARGLTRGEGGELTRPSTGRARRVLEVTPVRPTLSIGALRARIVKQFGLERFAIDVVICKRGDATRRQIRSDVVLRGFLVEE